jgi:hypothetical protein
LDLFLEVFIGIKLRGRLEGGLGKIEVMCWGVEEGGGLECGEVVGVGCLGKVRIEVKNWV